MKKTILKKANAITGSIATESGSCLSPNAARAGIKLELDPKKWRVSKPMFDPSVKQKVRLVRYAKDPKDVTVSVPMREDLYQSLLSGKYTVAECPTVLVFRDEKGHIVYPYKREGAVILVF